MQLPTLMSSTDTSNLANLNMRYTRSRDLFVKCQCICLTTTQLARMLEGHMYVTLRACHLNVLSVNTEYYIPPFRLGT